MWTTWRRPAAVLLASINLTGTDGGDSDSDGILNQAPLSTGASR